MNPAPRPSLLPLAAAVSLLVLLLSTVALFALQFTHQKSVAAFDRIGRFHAAQIAAVEAQVSFKTQVQEWKDTLLRGRNPKDRADYFGKFAAREQDVQAALQSAEADLSALGVAPAGRAGQLAEQHRALGRRYRSALAADDLAADGAAFRLDAAVRGIDRPLNDAIDQLAHDTAAAADAELADFRAAGLSRYTRLRQVVLGCAALAMIGAFALVWRSRSLAAA